jgi:hypothetical protein
MKPTLSPLARRKTLAWVCWGPLAAGLLVFALDAPRAAGQPPAATRAFKNTQFRYGVALPLGCRHDEGPGTLDAICSPQLDAQTSQRASAIASLVLEVNAEIVPADAGASMAELAQIYSEDTFRQELPQAICGEEDGARVKIEHLQRVRAEDRVVYSAGVTCAEVTFLGVGVRRATARTILTAGKRYHLFARALKDDFDAHRPVIDAFFSSFVVTAEETKTP